MATTQRPNNTDQQPKQNEKQRNTGKNTGNSSRTSTKTRKKMIETFIPGSNFGRGIMFAAATLIIIYRYKNSSQTTTA